MQTRVSIKSFIPFMSLLFIQALSVVEADVPELQAELIGDGWGEVTLATSHVCRRFGGVEDAPGFAVSSIPEEANYLVIAFSDLNYSPASNGGHGVVAYELATAGDVNVPSVPAHTFDLPDGFTMVKEHIAAQWDVPGAYLPPCSGGRGHQYFVSIYAVEVDAADVSSTAFAGNLWQAAMESPLAVVKKTLGYF